MSTRLSASVKPYVLPESDRHIVSRFAYGVDETLTREVRSAGSGLAWFERQLDHLSIEDSAADAVKSWYPDLSHDPATAFRTSRTGGAGAWDYGLSFVGHWISRSVLTKRHVHAQMVSFWSNLLYIPAHEDRTFPWRVGYDETIRTYAMTSFRQLLRACIVHPCMSAWLNNNENTNRGINENLGRELLELYTVGQGAGYSEEHVKNSARLLTGFRTRDGEAVRSWYDSTKHWTGRVQIMGFKHANAEADGRAALNSYLDYLALHPTTAKRIARRLCQRFVSDDPPEAIVAAVASAYSASRSDVASTLRALVSHPQFAATRRAMLRTPLDDVISTARVLGIRPVRHTDRTSSFAQHSIWMAAAAGQAPFRWPRPDGFPETSTSYASPTRMIQAWNQHAALSGNWWRSTATTRPSPASSLPDQWPRRLDELVDHQSRMLLGRPGNAAVVRAVCTALRARDSHQWKSADDLSAWQLNVIRGMILALPEGLKR